MILIFSCLSLTFDLPLILAPFAAPIHDACKGLIPQTSETENYRAIVCGASLPSSDFKDNLRHTGLVHLMVVSGSHVAFLELLVMLLSRYVPGFRFLKLPALLLFVLANQLDAAVVRALISSCLRSLNQRFQLSWHQVQILLMSGLMAFGFLKTRRDLLSLTLSWILGIALLKTDTLKLDNSFLKSCFKNTRIYLLIAPALLPFSLPHPVSILCNLVFAPIMGFVLFPASLLGLLLTPLTPLTDSLWCITEATVSFIASFTPLGSERCHVPLWILYLYIALLSVSAWINEVKRESR